MSHFDPTIGLPRTQPSINVSARARLIIKQAFDRFSNTVTPDEHRKFQEISLKDVRNAALQIEEKLAARRSLRNMRRLYPFLQGLELYSKSVEVLCNGTPYLPWIWAPVVLMLQISSQHLEAFEHIMVAYSRISKVLPRLDRLSEFLNDQGGSQESMALIYAALLEFHYQVYKLIRGRAWTVLFHVRWNRFDIRFSSLLEIIAALSKLVEKDTRINTVEISRILNVETLEKEEEEWKNAELSAALSWLGFGGNPVSQSLDNMTRDCKPETCEWILENSTFKLWLQDRSNCSVVWLHGGPGTGKTVLSAHLIRHLEKTSSDVYYIFCSPETTAYKPKYLLRSLVAQIVQRNPDAAIYVSGKYSKSDKTFSRTVLKSLLPDVLTIAGSSRLMIDGIDALTPEKQQLTLEDILALVSVKGSKYRCKLFISSRDTPTLSDTMDRQKDKVDVIAFPGELGIREVVWLFFGKIRNRFRAKQPISDQDESKFLEVEKLLIDKANGMFLFLHLALHLLEHAKTPDELHKTATSLPDTLRGLYDFIVRGICDSHTKSSSTIAIEVFQWVTYAPRPLKLTELLEGLNLLGELRADLPYTPYLEVIEDCKPLIEIRPSGTIDFIHSTVREYLLSDSSLLPKPSETQMKLINPVISDDILVIPSAASLSDLSSEGHTSQARVSTLPTSLGSDADHVINSNAKDIKTKPRGGDDADIRSLLSAVNYDGSQSVESEGAPDQQRNEIINGIVIVFSNNPALTPLYEKALELIPKNRLANNFRRLLKIFRDDLIQLPKTRVTLELTSLLRSRTTQMTIANRVIERHASPGSHLSEGDMSRIQGDDESTLSKLERLFAKGNIPPPPPNEPSLPPDDALQHLNDSESDNDDDDYDDEEDMATELDISNRPRLDQVIHTLVTSQPFQDMIPGLIEFLLPYGLLHDIMPIPRDRIGFSTSNRSVFLNRIQGWFEDITALEWDWWPFRPPMRPLVDGETRVYWRCLCGKLRWRTLKAAQKDLLLIIMSRPPALSRRPLVCASLYSHTLHTNPQARPTGPSPAGDGPTRNFSVPLRNITRSTTVASPTGNSSNVAQSNSNTSTSQVSSGISPAPGSHISTQTGYQQKKPLWFIFKIEGPRSTPSWAQLADEYLGSDRVFQSKLRDEHYRLRGRLRIWLSYWQLRYWEFVKLQKIRPGRIVDRGIDLPDSLEYDYSPRPPRITAKDPWISRHEFEEIVGSCISPCWLKYFPDILGIHDCACPEEDAKRIVGALPKRGSKFKIRAPNGTDDYVWGIHARYKVSSIRVFGIHVAILAITIGLWVWWQIKHPDDLQGASVPVTVAGICISTFWASTGILKGMR